MVSQNGVTRVIVSQLSDATICGQTEMPLEQSSFPAAAAAIAAQVVPWVSSVVERGSYTAHEPSTSKRPSNSAWLRSTPSCRERRERGVEAGQASGKEGG